MAKNKKQIEKYPVILVFSENGYAALMKMQKKTEFSYEEVINKVLKMFEDSLYLNKTKSNDSK